MPKYLLTFVSRDRNDRLEKTVEAPNMDAATRIGQSMNMYYKGYDNLWVEEYPYDSEGIFGLEVEVDHTHFGKLHEYVFIRAKDLNSAKRYYNACIKGQYFDHHKNIIPDSEGWQRFGRILNAYSVASDNYDFDALDAEY